MKSQLHATVRAFKGMWMRTSEAFEHQAVVGSVSRGGVAASSRNDKSLRKLRTFTHSLTEAEVARQLQILGFVCLNSSLICWSRVAVARKLCRCFNVSAAKEGAIMARRCVDRSRCKVHTVSLS